MLKLDYACFPDAASARVLSRCANLATLLLASPTNEWEEEGARPSPEDIAAVLPPWVEVRETSRASRERQSGALLF